MQYVGKKTINVFSHSIQCSLYKDTVSNLHIDVFLGQHVMKKEMGVIIGNIFPIISNIS